MKESQGDRQGETADIERNVVGDFKEEVLYLPAHECELILVDGSTGARMCSPFSQHQGVPLRGCNFILKHPKIKSEQVLRVSLELDYANVEPVCFKVVIMNLP